MIRIISPDEPDARPAKQSRRRRVPPALQTKQAIGIVYERKVVGLVTHRGATPYDRPDETELEFIVDVCGHAQERVGLLSMGNANWAAAVPVALRIETCARLAAPIDLPEDIRSSCVCRVVGAKQRPHFESVRTALCKAPHHGESTVQDLMGRIDMVKLYFFHASRSCSGDLLLARLEKGEPFSLPVPPAHVSQLAIQAVDPVEAYMHSSTERLPPSESGSSAGSSDEEAQDMEPYPSAGAAAAASGRGGATPTGAADDEVRMDAESPAEPDAVFRPRAGPDTDPFSFLEIFRLPIERLCKIKFKMCM